MADLFTRFSTKMSVRIFSLDRSKLPYLFALIFLVSGYFNHFFITEPIVFFFRISSLTGQILVSKFLSICNCTFEIVKLTYSFLQILYEDALIFLKDATEKFTFAIYLLKELYLFLEEFGWNILMLLYRIGGGVLNFFVFIQEAVGIFKEGLRLTGSTIWQFFTNVPQTVLCGIIGIIEFVRNTSNDIIISSLKVKEKIIQSIESTYMFLFDVPLDSVYGLIVGALLLTILCLKFKDICCTVSSAFIKLYQQVVSFGISLWDGRFLESSTTLEYNYSEDEDERLCIVCQFELKEVIIFPCKHLCLCQKCSKVLEKNHPTCPICRSEITGTLKVYL